MKIKIHQQDLLLSVSIIETALPQKTVIESLKAIKIEATKEEIIFTASKSELAITYKLNAIDNAIEIIETGTMLVSGTHFINIIKKLATNTVTLEKIDTTLHIRAPKTHIELLGYDITTYPFINFDLSESESFKINKDLFKEAYQKNKYAISKNQMKQIMTGINYKFTKNQFKVSSTDSLRMTFFSKDYSFETEKDITISKHIIQDLNKILDYTSEEEITLHISNNQILVKTQNLTIKSRLLDGEFPPIESIIPKTTTFSYEIQSKELKNALDRVLLLTDKDESVVTATFEDRIVNLTSSHQMLGGIEEAIGIDKLIGSPFSIAFDPQFVLDAIDTIDDDILLMEFVDEVSGFCIKGSTNKEVLNIISPIRMM